MDVVMMDLDGDPAERADVMIGMRRRCGRAFIPYDALECPTCGTQVGTRCRKGLSH